MFLLKNNDNSSLHGPHFMKIFT